MRWTSPAILAAAALMAAPGPAPAQESAKKLIEFSPDPALGVDGKPVKPVEQLIVRPNTTALPFFAYVNNLKEIFGRNEVRSFRVELWTLGATPVLLASGEAKDVDEEGEGKTPYRRVALKPAPAKPAAPKGDEKKPKEEVPEGVLLNPAGGKAFLEVRAFDGAGNPIKLTRDGGRAYRQRVTVEFESPKNYVKVTGATLGSGAAGVPASRVDLTIELNADTADLDPRGGPCPVKLVFPPQDRLDANRLGAGVSERNLDLADPERSKAVLKSIGLPLVDSPDPIRIYLNIDGVRRAYAYLPKSPPSDGKLAAAGVEGASIRLLAAGRGRQVDRVVTKPMAAFPVRLAVANSRPGDRLEFAVGPPPFTGSDPSLAYRLVRLGSPRRQRYWLNPAGPGGGIAVSNLVEDHVVALDLAGLRGAVDVVGRLLGRDGSARAVTSFTLVIDGTAPLADRAEFVSETLRGGPVRVRVTARDFETPVTRAVFFIGRPGEGGVVPKDAPKVIVDKPQNRQAEKAPFENVWLAEVPVPEGGKKKEFDLSVELTNEAGLKVIRTVKIKLVEPTPATPGGGGGGGKKKDPPTTGTVKGAVIQGGIPQPGLTVNLTGPDGKPAGVSTANDKGEFEFLQVKPGVYSVASAKKDAGAGTSGSAPVQVYAGKTAQVNVTLRRQP